MWPSEDAGRAPEPAEQEACAALAQVLANFEPVTMCFPTQERVMARALLDPKIRRVELGCESAGPRSSGPYFNVDSSGDVRIVNWRFDAWGGLQCAVHFPRQFENLLKVSVADLEQGNGGPAALVLDGISLRSDGQGTLFVVESSALAPNRHLPLSAREIGAWLGTNLGARELIWLPRGVEGGRQGDQIDNLMSPVRPGVVALAWTENRGDPAFEAVRQAHEVLRNARDARGRKFEIVRIPNPARTGASYVNHVLCNGAVVVPTFDDEADGAALAMLRDLYPDRRVLSLPVPGLPASGIRNCPHPVTRACESPGGFGGNSLLPQN